MKSLTLSILFLFAFCNTSFAQDFEWGKNINVAPYKWTVDNQENIIWIGSNNVPYDVSTDTTNPVYLPYSSNYNGYICKYDSAGEFLWFNSLSGTNDVYLYWVVVGNNGNITVGGKFLDKVDVDPSSGTTLLNAQTGEYFVAHYDGGGNYLWAFNNKARFEPFDVDGSGNIIFAGIAYSKTDINPGIDSFIVEPNASFNRRAFTAKFSATGQFKWAIRLGQGATPSAGQIKFDQWGNIYVAAGTFHGTVDFDPGPNTHSLTSPYAPAVLARFFASYDSAGNFRFVKPMWIENGAMTINCFQDRVYISKLSQGTIDIDLDSATINRSPVGTPKMIVVVQYDTSGSYVNDFKINVPNFIYSYVSVDGSGETVIGGVFTGNMDVDPSPATNVLNTFFTGYGYEDLYLAKYNKNLELKWAHQIGASGIDYMTRPLITDKRNNLYIIGSTQQNLNWNVQGGINYIPKVQPCICSMMKYSKLDYVDTSITGWLCPGDSLLIGETWTDTAGTFNDTLFSSNGADSIVRLTLTMDTAYTTIRYDTICENGQKWILGRKFSDTGVFYHTIPSSRVCDSTLEIHIAYRSGPTVELGNDLFVCNYDTISLSVQSSSLAYYFWHDNSAASSWKGVFKKGISDSLIWVKVYDLNNCPATDTILIHHNGLKKSTFAITNQSGLAIELRGAIDSSIQNWRWNFGDNTFHMGDTNVSHQYLESGNFTICLLSENKCRADSVCQTKAIGIGISNYNSLSEIDIFPNPTNGIFNIRWNDIREERIELFIYKITGEVIFHKTFEIEGTNSVENINPGLISNGLYNIVLKTDNEILIKKLSIQ